MAPHTTASPAEGVMTADIPTPTAGEMEKRQDTSTPAVKHAMTTPYVFPPSCAFSSMFTMTSSDRLDGEWGTVHETFLYISKKKMGTTDNSWWRNCQPTGSTSGYHGAYRVATDVYRGAVCPSGWIAHDVGLKSQSGSWTSIAESRGAPRTWSTAKCCMSGDVLIDDKWRINFDYGDDIHVICASTTFNQNWGYDSPGTSVFPSYSVEYLATHCSYYNTYTYRNVTVDENTSTSTLNMETITEQRPGYEKLTTMKRFDGGRAFYPPMSMEWLEEDNPTLTPKWPTLTSNMLLPTWPLAAYESSSLKHGVYDNRGKGRIKPKATIPNKVAIPIISTLAVMLLAALGGIAFLLWKGNKEGRPIFKAKKSQLEIPLDIDGGSTADLSGRQRTGDDMELRERLSEGLSGGHVLSLS